MGDVDLVHSHTWYANMAAHLTSLLYGIPHVLTTHSLEPLRPWEAEQLAAATRCRLGASATPWRAPRRSSRCPTE
jgi:starch synthase